MYCLEEPKTQDEENSFYLDEILNKYINYKVITYFFTITNYGQNLKTLMFLPEE